MKKSVFRLFPLALVVLAVLPLEARILPRTLVVSQFQHYMISEQPRGYLGRYADQPLLIDPELPPDPDRSGIMEHVYWGRFSSQANWEAAQRMADGYGLDGFAFFPGPERKRFWGAGEKSAVANFLNLPILNLWRTDKADLDYFRRAIANKRGYAFRGKQLILSYWTEKFSTPEALKAKLDKARETVGDTFWFVPDLSSIVNSRWDFNRHGGCLSDAQTRKLKETIRAYLRVADGVYCGDTFSVFTYERKHRVFYAAYWKEAVRLTKEVLAEPEFAGKKFLGLSAVVSHCNISRQYYTPHEDGTRSLRSSFATALAADPDFIMLPEWDEFNENTCFGPTLMNGYSTKRIVRQLLAQHRGEKPSPLPGDETSVPNLSVSVRPYLDPGEVLTVEVLAIPDGTFAEPIEVSLALTDPDGRELQKFPSRRLDGATLADVRFEAPSEELAMRSRALRLRLKWRAGEKSGTVSEGLPTVGLVSGSGWNCKWAHQPLRDLAPVQAAFARDARGKISASVASAEPIRYAMLFGNGSIQYIQGAVNDPVDRFHEDGETAVFEINPFAHRFFRPSSAAPFLVTLEGVSNGEWLDDRGVRTGTRYGLRDISHIARRAYVRLPKRDLATAKLVFDCGDAIRGTVPLRTAFDEGLCVISSDSGVQLVVSRFQKQAFYPIPNKTGACAFAVRPYAERPSMAYALCVVTMSGKTWRSRPLVSEAPSGVVPTRVYSEFCDRLLDIDLPRSRLPKMAYDFGAKAGDAILSGPEGGRAFNGARGGPPAGVVQMNRNAENAGEATYGAHIRSWATNTLPARIETDAGPAFAFDGFDDYFELPWGTIPVDGIYEMSFDVKPARTDEREMIAVSRAALTLLNDCGELVVNTYPPDAIVTSYAPERRTGLRFAPGVWNALKIRSYGDRIEATLNGKTAVLKTRPPTTMCSTVLFALSTDKTFKSFEGAIRNLKVDHAVSNAGCNETAKRLPAPRITVDGEAPSATGTRVELKDDGRVFITATQPISTVRLAWKKSWPAGARFLNDVWERSCGDILWQPIPEHRVGPWFAFGLFDSEEAYSPWYFLVTDGTRTDGYGVKVQPNALCCWKLDSSGYALEIDVTAGGRPVRLCGRALEACTVVTRRGKAGESAFAAGRAFCRTMCPVPRLAEAPVYGYNDWYCAYGKNTATNFLADAAFVCALAKGLKNRPYVVMDDGWQPNSPPVVRTYTDNGPGGSGYGPWDRSGANFGMEMGDFAARVAALGAKPGLWYRPYRFWPGAPEELKANNESFTFDPTKPDVKRMVFEDVSRFRQWGFKLVKIDYLTKDLCGLYGASMGERVFHADMGWADDTRTSAEVMLDLLRTMRAAAGEDVVLIGCNALNHLVAGLFELQRTGGDTSGWIWEQTVRDGVNTLAMRAIQDRIFFAVDADCVGLAQAGAIPWEKNAQWLDLVSRSGTPLFISWRRSLVDDEVREALTEAFRRASEPRPVSEPEDWLANLFPRCWRHADGRAAYRW